MPDAALAEKEGALDISESSEELSLITGYDSIASNAGGIYSDSFKDSGTVDYSL